MRIHCQGLFTFACLLFLGSVWISCGEVPSGGIVDNGVAPRDEEEEQGSRADGTIDDVTTGDNDIDVTIVLEETYQTELPSGFVADTTASDQKTFRKDTSFVTFAVATAIPVDCASSVATKNTYNVEVFVCSPSAVYYRTPAQKIVNMQHNLTPSDEASVSASFRIYTPVN
jgi:hypothetical protein